MKTSSTAVTCLLLTLMANAQTSGNSTGANQSVTTSATLPAPTPFRVIARGPDSRTWQRETYEAGPNGQVVTHIHKVTELASGMHVWQNGQYVESQELIEPSATGAIAQRGPYSVAFANDLNTAGAVTVVTSDGKQLTSNILGLGYYDSSSGQAVLLAQVKDSYGALLGANQVIYADAFDGLKANIIYTYKKSGFAQDVVLLEQPADPASLGLNPQTTKLEVFTEFIDPPDATVTVDADKGAAVDEDISWGTTHIGHGKAFDLSDPSNASGVSVEKQYLDINGRKILIEMVPLKAVAAPLSQLPLQSSINKAQPMMAGGSGQSLVSVATRPASPGLLTPTHGRDARATAATLASIVPAARKHGAKRAPMGLAMATPPAKGYVLDYVTLNVSETNFTFQGDTTYLISGNVNLAGITTIEWGSVIKLDTNHTCAINVLGTIKCQTGAYRPAIFTSADDGTVGEGTPSSGGSGGGGSTSCTGTLALTVQDDWNQEIEFFNIYDANWNTVFEDESYPAVTSGGSSGYSFTAGLGATYYFDGYDNYGDEFLGQFSTTLNNGTIEVDIYGNVNYSESGAPLCTPPPPPPPPVSTALSLANGGAVHDLRIANVDIGLASSGNYSVTNAQFVNCGVALQTENASFYAGNILMSGVGTGFYGQNFQGRAEQLTFDQGTLVTGDPAGTEAGTSVALVNALLTGVGGYGVVPVTTDHVANVPSAGVYQVAGAGGHYLATNSPYHNAGTANISPSLLAELGQRTTYAPTVYSGVTLTTAMTFGPQAARDNYGYPDYGYHYDPLDVVFGGAVAKSNLTFTAGTAAGWFYTSSGGTYGLAMGDSATASFNGTVTAPCHFARYSLVQEGNGNWTPQSYLGGITGQSYTHAPPGLTAQFTIFSVTATEAGPYGNPGNTGALLVFRGNHCEFYNNGGGGYYASVNATNCLFVNGAPGLWWNYGSANMVLQNCTCIRGNLTAVNDSRGYWPFCVVDTTFDGTTFLVKTDGGPTNGYYADYNAFLQYSNTTPYLGGHEVYVTGNYNWQSSWLGNYYLPSNSLLIDHGSTTADKVGLYHFTTQVSQMKETNSIVDIGYHYVAVDANGNPIDTTGDGIPDYLKDANGDGVYDAGDLENWLIGRFNGLSPANGLSVFTPLK